MILKRIEFIPIIVVLSLSLTLCAAGAIAEENVWSGGGDGSSWDDANNWSLGIIPTSADDVRVNLADSTVGIDRTFYAQSILLGGSAASNILTENFIYGTVAPESVTQDAIQNRRDGMFTLEGAAGTITLQGTYHDSEETYVPQPSFMVAIE